MNTGIIIGAVAVGLIVLFALKKKSGCCGTNKSEKGEAKDQGKGGCCGGH